MPMTTLQVSYFMLALLSIDGLMTLVCFLSIIKSDYPCSTVENLFREPMIQGGNQPSLDEKHFQHGTIQGLGKARHTIADESI